MLHVSLKTNQVAKRLSGAIMDITQHKLAEECIRRGKVYLAEAQRLSRTGSFGWNVAADEIV